MPNIHYRLTITGKVIKKDNHDDTPNVTTISINSYKLNA
jgi:hypothetical protein